MTDKNKQKEWNDSSKIYSRLRMIMNGSNEVNTIRALSNPTIAVRKMEIPRSDLLKINNQLTFEQSDLMEGYNFKELVLPAATMKAKKKKKPDYAKKKRRIDPPKEILLNVFIKLKTGQTYLDVLKEIYPEKSNKEIDKRNAQAKVNKNLVQVSLVATELDELLTSKKIIYIEGAQAIQLPPKPRLVLTENKGPIAFKEKHSNLQVDSDNVIIGIIDVGGYDFAHRDFLRKSAGTTKTRFKAIWDQGGSFRPPPNNLNNIDFEKFDYGSLITADHMNNAIESAPNVRVTPRTIEPQSQEYRGSHATHVASIAAGNSGACPGADIVGVLISLPDDNNEPIEVSRAKTFTDSSRISDAVDFILAYADEMNKPVSINISLGTNGHAHDGSSPVNRWIDARLSTEGRCVCVAAGNAGQEKSLKKDDFGYIMGRIHTSGQIVNKGLMTDLEWQVIGNGYEDISENELEIWYQPQDRFSVMIKPPGLPWIGPIKPQEFIENQQLDDHSYFSVYNKIYHPANGHNQIAIYLSPNLNKDNIIGIRSGVWKVRLIGDEIRNGHFDAWIERDNLNQVGQEFWNFPSFFTEKTNVDNKSINSLACGHNVVAVGNYDIQNDKINISSSQGPSRDNRQKPEIVAPGTNIVAASGFTGNGNEWTSKSGTSMASPYACGVAGLLLSIQPQLTSAQIAGIFKRTCSPVAGYDYNWRNDTGFGIIDIDACIKEANSIMDHQDITD